MIKFSILSLFFKIKKEKSTSLTDVLLLERITGLEPATSTLARSRSTK